MQRLAEHRTPMLAVMLAVLVALSSTLMMLITMGQPEETRVQPEKKLQDDDQLVARTNAEGKAHFGLGILNPIEHKITPVFNSADSPTNTTNATFTTATANSIANSKANITTFTTATATNIASSLADNNRNADAPANSNNLNMQTIEEENIKNNDVSVDTTANIFVNPKDNPTTVASCGQVITRDVILLKDISCPGVGMIVGTDGITINLNNHKLSLANNTDPSSRIPEIEKIGILVPGQKNITIRGPGVITGFDKAIEFAGSGRGYVLDLKLTGNNMGISLKASDKITIYRSFLEGNTIGIASQSSNEGLIMSNQISENTNEGIVVMDSNYFIIGANSLIGNGNIGIFLDVSSFNNTISSNNILDHTVDISNADGIPIHISMNEYFENRCGKALPDGIC
jgi:parallel beta-helix repeat protein